MSEQWRLVFLGGGQMAQAIARGVIAAGLLKPEQIAASEIRADRRDYLESKVGIKAVATNTEAVELGDVILLAVKPQDTAVVLSEIGEQVRPDQVVVSIAAGVTLSKLEAPFKTSVPVIRVMPNTPCLVGQGMAAIARGKHASPEHEARVLSI